MDYSKFSSFFNNKWLNKFNTSIDYDIYMPYLLSLIDNVENNMNLYESFINSIKEHNQMNTIEKLKFI